MNLRKKQMPLWRILEKATIKIIKEVKICLKKFKVLLLSVCVLLGLTGCNFARKSSVTYTYKVDTGDNIRVTLNTTDKYDLTSELPFTISKDGEKLTQGAFANAETFDQYSEAVKTDEKARLIDSGEKNGNKYIFWCYNDTEYNYVVLIGDSKTSIILGNPVSEQSAKECFERLELKYIK